MGDDSPPINGQPAGIVAIPKSTHKERMQQNFDIFDFELTAEEKHLIETYG